MSSNKKVIFLRFSQALTVFLGWPALPLALIGWGIPLLISFVFFIKMASQLVRAFKSEITLTDIKVRRFKLSIILLGLSFTAETFAASSLANLDTTGKPEYEGMLIVIPIIVAWVVMLWRIANGYRPPTLSPAQPWSYDSKDPAIS